MNDPVNVNLFEDIQAICREFRRDLKSGKAPRIENLLSRVDGSARENLFQNLLHLEIEFRRRKGEQPTSNQYIKRFPDFASIIRQAFFESTMMSQQADGRTPDDVGDTVTVDRPAIRKLGQYELLRELGRGGFGVVYEARHVQRGDRVALKTLPTMQDGQSPSSRDADRLHRFRREFRSLAEVNHPNLVGMQTLEVDGDRWFFTMDLIDGVDFLDYVRPRNELDTQRLLHVLPQLVRGIIALHQMGIVHRDLKPSNVLVTRDGHLTILDFGLVVELQHFASETLSMGTKQFAGTPRYAAPEQVSGERTVAVDWYALGTMLFEAITGEVPIRGSGIELMFKKQNEAAESLEDHPELPPELAELAGLVDELLRIKAGDRPGDEAIANRLGVRLDSTRYDSGSEAGSQADSKASDSHGSDDGDLAESSSVQEDEVLIGRETQLAELEKAFSVFRETGEPQAVFISGRSGEGKTTLVNAFLGSIRKQNQCLILSGRCYDRESVPFKAIDCLIDPLVAHLRSRSSENLGGILPRDIGMLSQLFPVLRRVGAIADMAAVIDTKIDSRQMRYRAFAAFRDLLIAIGQSMPVVLFIDDVQWGDADSAQALFETLKPPDGPGVMLLCSFRSDEAGDSPFLCDWNSHQLENGGLITQSSVEVAPLTEEECLQLASVRLGLPVESLQEQFGDFHRGTHGNPYFIEQLLDGYDDQSGDLRAVPLAEVIDRKLSRLPAGARPLLESIAIAGQTLALSEAAAIDAKTVNAYSVVTHMRSERLVRLIGGGECRNVDTYHDKIRETVIAGIKPPRRRELHLRFAEWLEAQEELSIELVTDFLQHNAHSARNRVAESGRVFDIAHHYFEAKHPHAFAYQLLAGITSLVSYAGDEAVGFLRRAAEVMPGQTDRSLRFLLKISLGRAYLICKESAQADDYFEQALEVAESPLQQAMVLMGLATSDRFAGRLRQAAKRYDLALKLIETPRPQSMLGSIAWILRDTFWTICAGTPRFPLQSSAIDESDESILEYTALWELGGFLNEIDILGFLACASKACRKSVDRNTAASLVGGYEWASGFFGAACLLPLASLYSRRAERIRKATGDPRVDEQKSFYHYGYSYWVGDLFTAEDQLERSWQTTKRLGEHYEGIYRPHMLRHTASFIRPTSVELRWAEATLESAKELGSEQQICWGTYDVGVALARRGEIAAANEKMSESLQFLRNERYFMTESIRGASLAFICLQASDYQQARDLAGTAWRNAVKHLILIDVAAYALPIYMESLAGPRWVDAIGKEERRSLRRLSWWAMAMFRFIPNHQPHLLRMRGRFDAGCGRRRKAERRFRRSIENARSRGMEYAEARALLDLAALASKDADSMRIQAIELLNKTESVIPYAEGWSLGDLYDPDVVASVVNNSPTHETL